MTLFDRALGLASSKASRAAAAALAAALVSPVLFAPAKAQETPMPEDRAETRYAEDTASIDAIVDAVYDVISGPAGEERDWDRLRALYAPGATMIPRGSQNALRILGPEDYIEKSGPLIEREGFVEREIARKTTRFGDVAQVMSTYEARLGEEGEVMRGVNALQLVNDGERWWVASIAWQQESDALPIPPEFLTSEE